jgi:predicted GH43/DUF377 family glycosyl hydrolase
MIAGLIKAKRNYNPSLVSAGEGFLLAYRSEPKDFTVSEIVLAELDRDMNVLSNQRLKVPGTEAHHSLEDPRLFWHRDQLHIAFSIANYNTKQGWRCVQAYGRLSKRKNWTLPKVHIPAYGSNDWSSKEKNWTFFEAEGALRCIYDMGTAGWRVLELNGAQVVNEWRHHAVAWGHGRMSGGSPAVPWRDQLLTAFHSWEKHPGRNRIYHMGFVAFDAAAPHAPRLISSGPVLTAQEDWGRPTGEKWAPLCVFPGGLEVQDDRALLSYGRNDASVAVAEFAIEDLVPTRPRPTHRNELLVRLTGNILVKGQPAYAGTEVALLRSDAADLIARGKAVAL